MDSLESIFKGGAVCSRHHVSPDLVRDALILREDGEMRTGLSLEPLEVVNLIPLIRRLRKVWCDLEMVSWTQSSGFGLFAQHT